MIDRIEFLLARLLEGATSISEVSLVTGLSEGKVSALLDCLRDRGTEGLRRVLERPLS